jgi:hypothetical protein
MCLQEGAADTHAELGKLHLRMFSASHIAMLGSDVSSCRVSVFPSGCERIAQCAGGSTGPDVHLIEIQHFVISLQHYSALLSQIEKVR